MGKRTNKGFQDITWFDLESWAGSKIVSRGRSYQRNKYVNELAITRSGELLAWVEGSVTYATMVSLDNGEISSVCTCPYHSACKHAVAVILEYLNCLENGRKVPEAGRKDERLNLISRGIDDEDDEYDSFDDEIEDEVTASKKPSASSTEGRLEDFLNEQSKSQLLNLITDILERHDEVREELEFNVRLKTDSSPSLAKTVEREIEDAAREPAWWNYRRGCGYRPDYSRVRAGLQRLLDEKQTDEALRLGEKLLFLGTQQVEQSHDEGDAAEEVTDCMTIVFKALRDSSLPNEEKMERAVDFALRDEYGLCDGLEEFWKKKFSKKDWTALADRLLNRLNSMRPEKDGNSFSRDYRRDRMTDEIIRALENAGRQEEVITLCLKEAEITSSYDRLVKHLRKARRDAEAEEWIRKGIAVTLDKWPGIANGLKEELLDIRRRKRDWNFVAAVLVDDFRENPSLDAFKELKKASEKAHVWETVRKAVLHFLENGKKPQQNRSDWPLPDTGLEKSVRRRSGEHPLTTVLIDIAIHEKKIDDVLKWYDRYKKNKQGWSRDDLEDRVAGAIAHDYPDKAVGIWKGIAEKHVSQTGVNFYINGARYLRKVKSTMTKNGEVNEWETYLQKLRDANRRKPR
ncbi:MAG TPA: SWIM zinc finger domain-containing protein, partial [Nitrospirae bacterium]|nr:SWIM zinc finger domain-containing protein [Nitrospirota bacterium]